MLVNKVRHKLSNISRNIVVINDVYKEPGLLNLVQEVERIGTESIDNCPDVSPVRESFVFPDLESLRVNNGRLNDFVSLEDAPSYSIDVSTFFTNNSFSLLVDCLVADEFVSSEIVNQKRQDGWMNEKFKVSLLVHESFFRAPTVNL